MENLMATVTKEEAQALIDDFESGDWVPDDLRRKLAVLVGFGGFVEGLSCAS